MTKVEAFKKVCAKYLIINNDDYIDVVFGVVFANRLDSKPVSLYLVGPPGGGKTEVLQTMCAHKDVISRSTLTTKSLISGFDGKKGKDESLIPQLDGKILVIKDFTTMLNMRREDLHEIIGILRDALDGSCAKQFGTGAVKVYKSRFGVIAACTDAIDKHRGLLSELGERFLTYRMPTITPCEKMKRSLKAMNVVSTAEQEAELGAAAIEVLSQDNAPASISDRNKEKLAHIAQIAALARTEVSRDKFTREPEIPRPEIATRLSKQLGDLAIGMAMSHGRKTVSEEDVILAQHVALHSISLKRLELFKLLISKYPEHSTCEEIAEKMRFAESAVARWMEDLYLLNLVEKKVILKSKTLFKQHLWRLRDGRILKNVLLR